jgi:integrase
MIQMDEIDQRWLAVVSWRDERGDRERDERSFRTRSDAITWAQEIDAERSEAIRRDMTVAQLVLGWHDDRRPNLRDTTAVREESMLLRHIGGDPLGVTPAKLVTRRDAVAFGERLAMKGNGRGAPLAPKTRRHVGKALRQAFDASWDIEVNPFARVALPALPDGEAKFLTRSEIDVLLHSIKRHRWGWAYAVLLLTGMRRSEFCGLRWTEIDLDAGHLDVKWRRTTAGSEVVEGAPKTRKARRRIPLDPLAVRLLRDRLLERDRNRDEWGPDWCARGDEYVWSREDGSLPHPDQLSAEFDRFCGLVGITNCGLHGLRHSFATIAIAAGVAAYSLSRMMGHSQVGFTLGVYGHLLHDGLQNEMAKMTELLGTSG